MSSGPKPMAEGVSEGWQPPTEAFREAPRLSHQFTGSGAAGEEGVV